MPRTTLAGTTALLAAPVAGLVATLIQPTLSDEAPAQVAALTHHRGATVAALALSAAAIALLTAGIVWLAGALRPYAGRLAIVAGALAVLGSLVLLFEDGVAAAAPAVVRGLDPSAATAALDRVQASAAVSALEPLSLLGDLGLALLGLAVIKAGAPTWTGAVIAVGALGQGIGFATATRTLVIAGFTLLLAGLVQAVWTLTAPGNGPRRTRLSSSSASGGAGQRRAHS